MPTYDPSKVKISWGGLIIQGFADDEFFSAEYVNDAVKLYEGCAGFTTLVTRADLIGLVKITTVQTSPTNNVLFSRVGSTAVLAVKDLSDVKILVTGVATLKKAADVKRGSKLQNTEWQFHVQNMRINDERIDI